MSSERPKMHFRNDLEMWHRFIDFGRWVTLAAQMQETELYSLCVHYSYDDGAFESYCNCPTIQRHGDFQPGEECWKCQFYKPQDETRKVTGL